MTLAATALSFAWSISAALVFALLVQSLVGRRVPALLSLGFVSVLILGLDLLLGITDGIMFIMNTAIMVLIQQSVTPFSIGVILAAIAILSMTTASIWSIISDTIEAS